MTACGLLEMQRVREHKGSEMDLQLCAILIPPVGPSCGPVWDKYICFYPCKLFSCVRTSDVPHV